MPNFVYSTATNSTQYVEYVPRIDANQLPVAKRKVLIKGGAGLARKQGLLTPYGVKTEVSDEDMEFLENDPNFLRHKDAGWMTVSKSNTDPDQVAADMGTRDGSSPLIPEDFADDKVPTATASTPPRSAQPPMPRFGKGK